MNRDEILEFLNANPACYLATVEDDQPRVRAMLLVRADDSGLLFHAGKDKKLLRQIKRNPQVEVCFINFNQGMQARISGRAVLVDDAALRKEIAARHTFMHTWSEAEGLEQIAVFRVIQCRAALWSMAKNAEPINYDPQLTRRRGLWPRR